MKPESATAGRSPAAVNEAAPVRTPPRLGFFARQFLALSEGVYGLGVFALAVVSIGIVKFLRSRNVVWPEIRSQIYLSGVRQVPMVCFMAVALGFVVAGQLIVLKSVTGVQSQTYAGGAIVTIVVRELGALTAALLILARIGTSMVIELGAAKVKGETLALRIMGVDPMHFMAVPRIVGMSVSLCCLTFVFNLVTAASAYMFMFAQDFPLPLAEYFKQISINLKPLDFLVLAIKPALFGAVIGTICCYQGMTRPSKLEHIGPATTTAVVQSVVICMLLNAMFVGLFYLI